MLAVGDALALVVSRAKGFSSEDFARFHPGGNLGRKLAKVEELMRPREQCRVAKQSQTLRETLVAQSRPGRRTGAIMIVDESDRLVGIFTDSDLARLLEAKREAAIDGPLSSVMTRAPTTIGVGQLLSAACEILSQRKISELPVVDQELRPMGLIDITDVVGSAPDNDVASSQSQVSSHLKSTSGTAWLRIHKGRDS
jgi:arabinose-5-phosphate isomerase